MEACVTGIFVYMQTTVTPSVCVHVRACVSVCWLVVLCCYAACVVVCVEVCEFASASVWFCVCL